MNPTQIQNVTAVLQVILGLVSVGAICLTTWVALHRNKRSDAEEDQRALVLAQQHEKDLKEIRESCEVRDNALQLHLIECARSNGSLEEMVKTLFKQQERMEASIAQLQAQFRLSVAHASNRFFKEDQS